MNLQLAGLTTVVVNFVTFGDAVSPQGPFVQYGLTADQLTQTATGLTHVYSSTPAKDRVLASLFFSYLCFEKGEKRRKGKREGEEKGALKINIPLFFEMMVPWRTETE